MRCLRIKRSLARSYGDPVTGDGRAEYVAPPRTAIARWERKLVSRPGRGRIPAKCDSNGATRRQRSVE